MKDTSTLLFLSMIFIGVGILLTMENIGVIHGVSVHWPVFLLIAGSGLILLYRQRHHNDSFLLWFGIFNLQIGFFFYYLNFTTWLMLNWLWPIFIGITGFSFLLTGLIHRRIVFISIGIIFILLFLTFTLIFTISKHLWPVSFVVFGLCLFVIEYMNRKIRKE